MPLVSGSARGWQLKEAEGSAAAGSRTPQPSHTGGSSSSASHWTPTAAAAAVPAAAPAAKAEPTVERAPKHGRWERGTKPPGAVRPGASPELLDLVATMNVAARDDVGDIVWFGYNSSNKGLGSAEPYARVSFGSNCIGWTARGARKALELASRERPQHWDNWLLWHLENAHGELKEPRVGASFVSPPIGGFETHESDNCQGKDREAFWQCHWSAEGSVRQRSKQGNPRNLCRFLDSTGSRSPLAVVTELVFDSIEESFLWRTESGPKLLSNDSQMLSLLVANLGWGDGHGNFWGPQWTHEEHQRYKKNLLAWEDQNLAKMRHDPDGSDEAEISCGLAVRNPLSRIGLKVGTLIVNDRDRDTGRVSRSRHIFHTLYKCRFFVPADEEAVM